MVATLVQSSYGATIESPPGKYTTASLGATPAPGNILVATFMSSTNSMFGGSLPAGWVRQAQGHVTAVGGQAKWITMWTKVAGVGEPKFTSSDHGGGSGQALQYKLQEWSGVVSVDGTPGQQEGVTAPNLSPAWEDHESPSNATVTINPTAGISGVIIAGFSFDGPHMGTAIGGLTIDSETGVGPPTWSIGHLLVGNTTGGYQVGFTPSSGFHRGVAVAIFLVEATPPGIDIDVLDPDFTFLDSIDDAKRKTIRVELQGTGQGTVSLRRDSAHATTSLIKRGNWVKVPIPQIWSQPIFLFRIESIETTVLDTGESGGEEIVFGGRGAMVYFDNYRAWNESFVVPAGKNTAGGMLKGPASTGNEVGQLLARMLAEGQHVNRGVGDFGHRVQPIPLFTYDFNYTVDSDGNAWTVTASTAELAGGQVGDSGLKSIQALIGTGAIDITIEPWQDPDSIPLRAYNEYSRDLTGGAFGAGVVRFVAGVNIAERLKSSQGTEIDPTIELIQGQDNAYGYAESPVYGDTPDVESFISTFGTDPATLEEIGLSDMARRIRIGQSVAFKVRVPMPSEEADPANGIYLPGPEGSNGHYWIGDRVTLDTGTGYGDFDDATVRVMAITITENEAGDLVVIPELVGVLLSGRLRPTTGTPGNSGAATGGNPPAPPPAGASADAHVGDGTDAHNASAISVADSGSNYTATNVETALAEVMDEVQSHEADSSDAHDASAVSVVPFSTIAATNVQAALEEIVAEATGGGFANPMTTAGDIIVGGASGAPTRLPGSGTDGWVATYDSAASPKVKWAAPGGGGSGALVLLEQHTASASATLDFTTCISSTYDDYLIELVNVIPATNSVQLFMRFSTDGGSSYLATAYAWSHWFTYPASGSGVEGSTSDVAAAVSGGAVASAGGGVNGSVRLYNPGAAGTTEKVFTKDVTRSHTSVGIVHDVGSGQRSVAPVNALRFLFSSGNIASGTIRIYGIVK